ncbi:MAG: hypothetical protein ABI896_10590 [Actinomycetota bacterium]
MSEPAHTLSPILGDTSHVPVLRDVERRLLRSAGLSRLYDLG